MKQFLSHKLRNGLAAGALLAGALAGPAAQAQVVLDGRLQAAENSTTLPGYYTSIGQYTRPHTGTSGFGNWGLLQGYISSDDNNLYVGVRGTSEPNGNAFQIYLDVPGRTGALVGTSLPTGPGGGTSFDQMNGRFDMQADYGLAVRSLGTAGQYGAEYVDYTRGNARGGFATPVLTDGTPALLVGTGNAQAFNAARVAYRAATPDLTGNVNEGLEVSFDLAALGLAPGETVRVFVLYTNDNGSFTSTDFLPESPGLTANPGGAPDYPALAGTQAFTFNTYASAATTRCNLAAPVASASPACAGGTFTLSATNVPAGASYQWSGPNGFSSAAAAPTVPATAAANGTYLLYILSGNCGAPAAPVTVTVGSAPAAPTTTGGSNCGPGAVTLSASGAPAGSTYAFYAAATGGAPLNSGTGSTFTTPSLTATTPYYVSAVSAGGCEGPRATVTATINRQPTAALAAGGPTTFCQGGSVVLTASGGAASDTYQFFLNGQTISGANGTTYMATAGGSYTVVVTTTDACTATSAPTTVTVNPNTTATFAYGAAAYCQTGTNPTPTITGTAGGAFSSATGLSLDAATGAVNLSTSTAGTYTVTYAVGGSCPSSTPQQLTVTTPAQAAFSYPNGAGICTTTTGSVAAVLGTGSTPGTFTSTAGLTLNATTGAVTPSTSTAGTYTVTNTVAASGGCATVTAMTSVTINAPQTAGFSYGTTPAYCTSATGAVAAVLGTGSTPGTFTSTAGLTLNATTGAVTPSTSTAGTYTVTNTVAASGGCATVTAMTSVTINTATSAAFAYATPTYCQSGVNPTPSVTGTAGGTFTVAPATGLGLNATTGALTLAGSTAGTYNVTYSVGGPCPSSSTATVTITTAPQATFIYAATAYCTTATATAAPAFPTGSGAGVFSSTAGLSLNATTGAITPSTSTPSTYIVTNTVAAANGCAAVTATTTVTITAPQTAGFSYGTTPTYCVNGSVNPSPTLATGASAGTFSSTAGLSLNAATGAITLSTSTPSTYTVTNTVAASGGCAAVVATTTVTISAAPSAAFAYANAAYCQGAAAALPTVTGATGGTFSVAPATGLTVNATTGALTLVGATPAIYTVTYSVTGTCSASRTFVVTVNARPATPTLATSGSPAAGIVLTSSSATGNQFFLNGVAVAGAMAQTLLINSGTRNGSYTVTTTNAAGCVSLPSAAVTVTVTAARPGATGPAFSVYPNPTPSGLLQVALAGYPKAVELTVVNALGQEVFRQNVAAGSQTLSLDLSALPAGIYVLQGRSSEGTTVRRFVRE